MTSKSKILFFIFILFVGSFVYLSFNERDLVKLKKTQKVGGIESLEMPSCKNEKYIKVAILDTLNSKEGINYADEINIDTSLKSKTHSDEILSIVSSLTSKNTKIDLFVISDEKGRISKDLVLENLKTILGQDYDVVNMSFYLKSGDLKIDKLLEQLYNKNVALVSSSGNQGLKKNNYPSSNTKVLSVGGIKDTGEKWINSNYGYIDFVMPVQIKSYIDGEQIEGTSVSAAILTAFIANTKNCFFIKNNTELYKKLVVLAGKTERDSQIGYGQPNYKNMR